MRITLEPGYVLHRRAYRETSFLFEIYTLNHGRLSLIAKGVRQSRSHSQALLQPFRPLLFSFSGQSELKLLLQVEPHGEGLALQGDALFSGFYVNELILYLTQKWDANPNLYELYHQTLFELQPGLDPKVLRLFEKKLLEELGYGMLSKSWLAAHNPICPGSHYRFVPELGFELSDIAVQGCFLGQSLLDYAHENWQSDASLQDAKRLNRVRLAGLLGGKKLHSRELFKR